jgi:hypothetical protein
MPHLSPLVVAALACALVTPAMAEMTWSVETGLAHQTGATTETTLALFPSLTLTLPLDNGWSVGLEAFPELYFSHRAGDVHADDPYVNLILSLTSPTDLSLGLDASTTLADWSSTTDTTLAAFIARPQWNLTVGDTAAAASELCLTPDLRSLGDLTTTDTCPVFLDTRTIRGVFGAEDMLRHAFSYAKDNGATSASYAIAGPISAASFSLGAEVHTTPGTRAHLLQAGLSYANDTWGFATAAAVTHSPDSQQSSWQAEVTHRLDHTFLLAFATSYGAGSAGYEKGAGLAVDITAIPDRLTVTTGLARIWTAQAQDTRASLTFVLSGKSRRQSPVKLRI